MTQSARDLVDDVQKLTTFPDVAFRIDELLSDDKTSITDIGRLIETDPALSAAMLRLANSAAYTTTGSVETVNAAVKLVGARETRDLIYAICTTTSLNSLQNDLVSLENFWKHSLYCGVAAQTIAKAANVCRGKSPFTAGLLHDIGLLVMLHQCPDLSEQTLKLALDTDDSRSTWLAEREIFGFDHMTVGDELARSWQFPESIRAAIANHHLPHVKSPHDDMVKIVHIANSIAVLVELKSENLDDGPPMDRQIIASLGLNEDILIGSLESVQDAATELVHLFSSD